MIDIIDYSNNLSCTVFDEPFQDYYDIILNATAFDTHRLTNNYKTNVLEDMEFMCLWKLGDKRMLYGLQHHESLPSNVARVFSRFYLPTNGRDIIARSKDEMQCVMSFYNDHPQYHQRLGYDTLFFTREVVGNKKDIVVTKLAERSGFKKIEEPRYYRKTLQNFYVLGNTNFVTAFPLSLVGPSK